MKNKIKKILLIIMVIIMTITTYNFSDRLYCSQSDEEWYLSQGLNKYGLRDSDYPKIDNNIYNSYNNEYFKILYYDLGYRFARVSQNEMYTYAACFNESMEDKMMPNGFGSGGNATTVAVPSNQKKNQIASYINDHKEQFIKIENSSSFIITDTQISIKVGKTYQLGTDTTNTIKWKSSNKKIASVSSSGKIIAKKSGNTVITAIDTVTGAKAYCTINVYKKKSDNLEKWGNKILKITDAYMKLKEGQDINDIIDCSCAGFAIHTINKVCGSNNYYYYTTTNYSSIRGIYNNKNITAKVTKIKKQLKAKDLQTGDIVTTKLAEHAYIVIENCGNCIKIAETYTVGSNMLIVNRRIPYYIINKEIKSKKGNISVLRHKKLA